jgi:hypothetical protein
MFALGDLLSLGGAINMLEHAPLSVVGHQAGGGSPSAWRSYSSRSRSRLYRSEPALAAPDHGGRLGRAACCSCCSKTANALGLSGGTDNARWVRGAAVS